MTWPLSCVRQAEPLSEHTSFRIGGRAEYFAEPQTRDELGELLRACTRLGLPISVLGGGTNTLAADRGVRGVVVHLGRAFRTVQELSDSGEPCVRVRCGASLLTQRLVTLAARRGWDGLEVLAGLPGQLGGAVAMNAQQIGRFVERVRMVTLEGTMRELSREDVHFAYRDTALGPGIVVEVDLRFAKAPVEETFGRIRRTLAHRNRTQEIRLPSAGCAFVNPPGDAAGRLIDAAGLKGSRIGDAKVSERHANFIVNLGGATCDDVLALMEYVQRHVRHLFGVVLRPEIRLIGERWGQ